MLDEEGRAVRAGRRPLAMQSRLAIVARVDRFEASGGPGHELGLVDVFVGDLVNRAGRGGRGPFGATAWRRRDAVTPPGPRGLGVPVMVSVMSFVVVVRGRRVDIRRALAIAVARRCGSHRRADVKRGPQAAHAREQSSDDESEQACTHRSRVARPSGRPPEALARRPRWVPANFLGMR